LGLRSPWLLLKASLSVCRTLLLLLSSLAAGAACWELLSKQRVSPRLLSVVVLVKPVVGLLSVLVKLVVRLLLSVLVELVIRLLSVLVELVVRLLLSVLVELLLVVLVEPLLLSVVVLRELIAVVLLAVVLLTVVLLAVVLLLFTVAEGTDVDVSSKTWNILSPPVAGDGLGYSSVRHSVLVQNRLGCSVPSSTSRTGAAIATIAQIPSVALTSGVGRPGPISCTNGINISSSCAVKPASAVKKSGGAITGDPGAKSGNLFLNSGFVLHTTRDVSPCSVVLTEGDIVSTSLTNNLA